MTAADHVARSRPAIRRLQAALALGAFALLAWSASGGGLSPTRDPRPPELRAVIAAVSAQVAEWRGNSALRGRDIVALPICVSTEDDRYVSVMLWLARPLGEPTRLFLIRDAGGYRTLTFEDGDILLRQPPGLPDAVWQGLHREACEFRSGAAVALADAQRTAPIFHTSPAR
ncbi:MAG TPA: hypothetical protein VF321_00145 [Gaiellaceae bacterium]